MAKPSESDRKKWVALHVNRNCGGETNSCPLCIAEATKRWYEGKNLEIPTKGGDK